MKRYEFASNYPLFRIVFCKCGYPHGNCQCIEWIRIKHLDYQIELANLVEEMRVYPHQMHQDAYELPTQPIKEISEAI